MAIVAIRCPNCNGDVQLDDTREFGFCMYCGTKIMIRNDPSPESSLAGQVANLKPLMISYFDAGDLDKAQEYARRIIAVNGADAEVWYVDAVAEVYKSPDMLDVLRRNGTVPGLEPLRNYEILSGQKADPTTIEKACFRARNKKMAGLISYGTSARGMNLWLGSDCRKWMAAETHIEIPAGVTSVSPSLFTDFKSLKSVSIPPSVTSIGDGAFWGCSSLESVSIPPSVTSIGDGAFWGCSSLTSISIPSSVTSIGARAIMGCSSLTSISIPSSVTSIGDGAFYGCSSLDSVSIPPSVTSIGKNVFEGCPLDAGTASKPATATATEVSNPRQSKKKGLLGGLFGKRRRKPWPTSATRYPCRLPLYEGDDTTSAEPAT